MVALSSPQHSNPISFAEYRDFLLLPPKDYPICFRHGQMLGDDSQGSVQGIKTEGSQRFSFSVWQHLTAELQLTFFSLPKTSLQRTQHG